MNRWCAQLLALLLGWGAIAFVPGAGAACLLDSSVAGEPGQLVKRLAPGCTEAEREAHAVSSTAIMEALEKGQPVDLAGVIVRGDLIFDRLPVETVKTRNGLPSEEQKPVTQVGAQERRLARGALAIRDSVLRGTVRHRSAQGTLRFEGPVDFQGTTFEAGVDLSRSVFQGTVELSGAAFQQEAFFLQGQFMQAMVCRETRFGPHTRFHRSAFHGPVECAGALFDGMAEFLEVTFDQPAVFERARFGSGTGFSGSRFKSRTNFDEAIFSRDTFFGFSVFEDRASFAGAQFLGAADFSDADFQKPDGLATARFDRPPLFIRTRRVVQDHPPEGLDSLVGRNAVTAGFLFLAALLAAYVLKKT
jgi:uncharacterized protein YjbI with pentapeptide repeats